MPGREKSYPKTTTGVSKKGIRPFQAGRNSVAGATALIRVVRP